jgi:hypothetical protein
MLFAYFLKPRGAFLAGLYGLKLIEPQPKTSRWRQALDEWEERHPRLMLVMGCSVGVFLLAAWALGRYSKNGDDAKQLGAACADSQRPH